MLNILSIEYSLWNFVPYFFKNCWYFLITVEQIIRKDSDPKQGRLVFFRKQVQYFLYMFMQKLVCFCCSFQTWLLKLRVRQMYKVFPVEWVRHIVSSKRNIPRCVKWYSAMPCCTVLYSMYVYQKERRAAVPLILKSLQLRIDSKRMNHEIFDL